MAMDAREQIAQAQLEINNANTKQYTDQLKANAVAAGVVLPSTYTDPVTGEVKANPVKVQNGSLYVVLAVVVLLGVLIFRSRK